MNVVLAAVWNFVKAHWGVVALGVLLLVGYFWFQHQQALNAQMLAQLNTSHQQALDQINKARADEATQHQQELQQYQAQLQKIQEQFALAEEELQKAQNQEQQQIVQKYGNDAGSLAQLLAGKEGFTVVEP